MVKRIAAIAVVMSITFAPAAAAAPTSPLCDDGSWRKAHPLICDTGGPGPFSPGGGGGGGGGRGIIGRILGGLTGGLL